MWSHFYSNDIPATSSVDDVRAQAPEKNVGRVLFLLQTADSVETVHLFVSQLNVSSGSVVALTLLRCCAYGRVRFRHQNSLVRNSKKKKKKRSCFGLPGSVNTIKVKKMSRRGTTLTFYSGDWAVNLTHFPIC